MANIGFLGCGKIGKAMARHIQTHNRHNISFIQDPFFQSDGELNYPVVEALDENICKADLVVECATADVLKQHFEYYLGQGDMLVFSLTAFSDESFANKAYELCRANNTTIYFPHGAILGLDGIFDARDILSRVSIETIKNPASLGRNDTERTLVYTGCSRDACNLYPRNVNVHAAIALAGLGFDKTQSSIISDPSVNSNSHVVSIEGEGINFRMDISSFATGGVSGSYTPISACGSLERALGGSAVSNFV
jgi:aspartate dehydrogenase